MPIGGSATEFNITGAKLKVSGGVQVSGSIAYTTDATGFGGVTAQIDGNNTLNITSGKLTGVTKIDRSTAATITAITHTNVNNNTTIHIALKNTSSTRGVFITLGTFASDDTVKVNYTDDYMIGPGETGMLTLRKVNGVLSLFAREMFSDKASTFTDDNTDGNRPFYIKDGVNYKYPLYKYTAAGLTSEVIQGTTYYKPTAGISTKSRPPKGIPELIVSPSGNLAIGNNGTGTTVNYDVWGVPSSFDFGSIYKGDTKKASFLLENGEASGSFTESGASSGDAYSLYVERTDLSTSDTVSFSGFIGTIAFHHGTFTSSDYSSAYSTVGAAATAGFVYSDTDTTISYTWGTLNSVDTSTSGQTGYTWTPTSAITADVLMVAGGGGGGGHMGAGGGAGGLLFNENVSLSGQKNIVVGNGGTGGVLYGVGTNGTDTTFTDLSTVVGGGRGGSYVSPVLASGFSGANGGSGGGSGHNNMSGVVVGQGDDGPPKQGYDGGQSTTNSDGGGGGGAGGVGGNGSGVDGGAGGIGSDQSSNFTTVYGDSGYFASGGGGGSRSATAGTASDGGGSNGTYGNNSALAAQKHTGGGGGGGGGTTTTGFGGGDGGSGIVLIKSSGTGKKIPKVTGASFDSTNVTFTVQGASNITNIKYTINGGSEVTTPVGTLAVAHSLASAASISVVAWAVDTNGNQLSAKKTVTGTIP